MRYVLRFMLRILFQLKLVGQDRLPSNGPAIILSNHVSFLDAIFLYAYLPSGTYFVVNTSIAGKINVILKWINHVTVDPLNPYSLKKVVNILKEGHIVVIFPEGRITTTGNLMKVYSGVGFIAGKTGADLCPVIFLGPEKSKLSRIVDKVKACWFPSISIYVGEQFRLQHPGLEDFRQQKKETSDQLLDLLQETMFKAKQHFFINDNIFNAFLKAPKLYGAGKISVRDMTGSVTYRRIAIASYTLGSKLREMIKGQKVIGLMLPNSIGHVVALFSLLYLGKTPAILNFSAGIETNMNCSEMAEVKTIVTSRLFVEKGNLGELVEQLSSKYNVIYLEELREQVNWYHKVEGIYSYLTGKSASPGEDKIILFTSGSESKPKGVVLSHNNILSNINQISCVIDYLPCDSMLNALPMFHSFGLTAGTLLPVLSGITVFMYPTPLHYKIIPDIAYDQSITLLLGTPTFLLGYAKYAHRYDFNSVRYVLAGGEKLKAEVRQVWQDKFGIRVLEGYGTTETAPVLSLNTPLFNRIGTVGKFLPGIEWRIEPINGIEKGGNLLVKGPNVMQGYLLHGSGFIPAPEWYDCGDVVYLDSDGFISIESRLKRFAKISGEMVSLDAVEGVAEACLGKEDNAAISLPDARRGEKIILYTTAKDASRQSFREYLSQSGGNMLAMPAEIIIVDKLPLLGSGKTDYVSLKASVQRDVTDHG